MMKAIEEVMDSLDLIAGEDGKPILPLFISESLSDIYFRSNPILQKEFIGTVRAIGIHDNDFIRKGYGLDTFFDVAYLVIGDDQGRYFFFFLAHAAVIEIGCLAGVTNL